MKRYELVFDGGSIGNPGRAYGSFQLSEAGTRPGAPTRLEFGHGTNNQAEYQALIAGVQAMRDLLDDHEESAGDTALIVRGDSQLVINQMAGNWKIKSSELLKLHDQALDLLAGFGQVEFVHQPRSKSQRSLGH